MFVADDRQWRPYIYSEASTTQRIAFVLTDSCDLLGVGVIAEALECASALATAEGSPSYEMLFLSASGGPVKCDRSLIVSTDKLSKTYEMRFANVFVAGGPHSQAVGNMLLHAAWLQRMKTNGTPVKFLTAGSEKSRPDVATRIPGMGGLNGHIQQRNQRARLGGALKAAFDVICADFGESVAREALRRTAFVDGKEALLAPADTAVTSTADRIRAAARWLQENCHRSVCIAEAADACAMSQRTLLRNFQTYFGTSPSEYLQRVRLERACELLAETSLPADKVARRVGLTNGDRLGKLFRRSIGKSPTEYRAWRLARQRGEDSASRSGFASHSQVEMQACGELP